MLADNNLEISANTKAIYNLEVKRGVFWSKRRIELTPQSLKYFDPLNNELRFSTTLSECDIKIDSHEKYVTLFSKNNKFKEIKVGNLNLETLKSFTDEFIKFKSLNDNISQSNTNDFEKVAHHEDVSRSELFIQKDSECYDQVRFKSDRKSLDSINNQNLDIINEDNSKVENYECADLNLISKIDNYTNLAKSANFKVLKCKDGCMLEYNGDNKNILDSIKFLEKNRIIFGLDSYGISIALNSMIILLLSYLAYEVFYNHLIDLDTKLIVKICASLFLLLFVIFMMLTRENISKEFSKINNIQGLFKISKIFEMELNDVQFYIQNTDYYPNWNAAIEKVVGNSSKNNSFKLTYNLKKKKTVKLCGKYLRLGNKKSNSNFELNFIRIKRNNTIVDYDIKSEKIIRLITIESNKPKYQTKFQIANTRVNIYIPLEFLINRIQIENDIGCFLLKTEFDSLSKLEISIKNEIFSKESKLVNPPKLPFDKNEEELKDKIKVSEIFHNHPIPAEYADLYQTLKEFRSKNWISMEEKNDYKTYYFDEPSGFRSIKGEAIINKNIKIVYDYVLRLDVRSQYDKNFDTGEIIKQIDQTNSICYLKFKGKLMFAPRDFVVCCHEAYHGDEAFILGKTVVNEKVPKYNKIERADLIFACCYLKKIDDNKTLIVFYTLSDLKIAQYLVNQALKDMARSIKYLKEILDKN